MKKFFTVLLAAMFLFCAAGCAREEKGTQTLSVRVMTHNMRYASNATDTDYGGLRADADERVLVTTLTKRMAEDLTDYMKDIGIRVRYLHSDIDVLTVRPCSENKLLGIFITKSSFAILSISSVSPPTFLFNVGVGIIMMSFPFGSIKSNACFVKTMGLLFSYGGLIIHLVGFNSLMASNTLLLPPEG